MIKRLSLKNSILLHSKAKKVMPGGVSSNARLWYDICPIYGPCSIFIEKAKGSHMWDVDGNQYIDYRLGFGPVILGHADPFVKKRIREYDRKGTIFAFDTALEIQVANKFRSFVPSAEMIRFSVSGTEATMHALRIARGYTGKEKVVKFEGHYHGGHDYLLFSTASGVSKVVGKPHPTSLGIPKALEKLIIVNEWNDFESIEKTIKKHAKEIAAIITEPVMGNAAAIPPKKGYLKHLKDLCEKNNIVLIFDEVKTGFRLSKGGAQQLFGVKPHLSTFAKSMANGYPISAIVGLREIMEYVGSKKVFHGGTYAGHPISLVATDVTLDQMKNGKVHNKIENFGKTLMKGIQDIFHDRKMHTVVQGFPSMFQYVFTEKEIYNYRDLMDTNLDLYSRLQYLLFNKGIIFDENIIEPIFTSAVHTKEDLTKTLEAIDECLPIVLKSKIHEVQRF